MKLILNLVILSIVVFVISRLWSIRNNFSFDRQIMMPNYSYTDDGNYIFAQGSWISTTDLAEPLQTINFECQKKTMTCISVDSTLSQNNTYLSGHVEYIDIDKWNDEEIVSFPSIFGCVDYTYRIDRKAKTIVSQRTTINTEGTCKAFQKEPIILTLGDGEKRIMMNKGN